MEPKFADHLHWELTRTAGPELALSEPNALQGQPRELETEEALAVAVALGRAGCRVVTLAGLAERSDWPQIAQVLARSGVCVRLITDGRRFGRIEARLARAARVSTVLLRPTGLGSDSRARLQEAAAGLDVAGVAYRREDGRGDAPCGQPSPAALGSDEAATPAWPCEAGRQVLGLRCDGTITECLALPGAVGVGNVRQNPLPQLWRAAQTARAQRLAARTAPPCVAATSARSVPSA